jgi:histidinol-phosphatase
VSLPEDLELALELADVADAITLAHFRAEELVVTTKPDLTPVTEADTAVELALRDRIATARPADSIVGEEYGPSTAPDSDRRWIIDPIDGTKSYVRGIPVWATLIALQDDDGLALGVASAPGLHRRWWASRGAGAFTRDGLGAGAFTRDGLGAGPRRLHVSGVTELGDAQLCFSGLKDWDLSVGIDALLTLGRHVWHTRAYADFLGYMFVAEGAAEICCDPIVSLWDVAAPRLIIEEAGGRFTDLGGVATADGGDALASNGLLHEAALAIIGRRQRPSSAN